MRTFIHYDQNGEIIAVAQVEVMPEYLPHPFNLTDEGHGVLELDADDPLAERGGRELHGEFVVDVKSKRLRKASEAKASEVKASEVKAPEAKASEAPAEQTEPEEPRRTRSQPRPQKPGGGQR